MPRSPGHQPSFLPQTVCPSFEHEDALGCLTAGVDEAGRGPLAGPVVAAAVILDPARCPDGLADSKTLPRNSRERLFDLLKNCAEIGIGIASVREIDEINILQASLLAMRRAVSELPRPPGACLVDGNQDPGLGIRTRCLVKGDALSFSIAAASIVAKVTRDRMMADLARDFPDYGWETNAGYGVPRHLKALSLVGVSPHHRRSFAPVYKRINEEQDASD